MLVRLEVPAALVEIQAAEGETHMVRGDLDRPEQGKRIVEAAVARRPNAISSRTAQAGGL